MLLRGWDPVMHICKGNEVSGHFLADQCGRERNVCLYLCICCICVSYISLGLTEFSN